MPHSLSAVYLHLVFSTKHRQPFLDDPALRAEMHACIGGVSKRLDCQPIIAGGVADHMHLLAMHGRTISQSEWVKEVKRVTSIWIKKHDKAMMNFAWQRGYGVFSVSASKVEAVRRYIAQQEQHHRKPTFQDEFRLLLEQHGLEWDERTVWD
jgi:putative transposase